jgi:hypothetical protein
MGAKKKQKVKEEVQAEAELEVELEPVPVETEPEPPPPEAEMGPDLIREWAKENLDRAKALGKRLIQAKGPDDLVELESLGDFEDKATEWAIAHPFKAKLLILSLVAELG